MPRILRNILLVIGLIAAGLFCLWWFLWVATREIEQTAWKMIGRPHTELVEVWGEPKHIVSSETLAGRTVDYPWKGMKYLPIPNHPVRNKVLLYAFLDIAIYVYVDERGIVEHVARAAT